MTWINSTEARAICKCSLPALLQRIERKTIVAEKVGGRWRIDSTSLDRKHGGRPRKPGTAVRKRPRGRPRKS